MLVFAGLVLEVIAMYLFPKMFGEQMIPFYIASLFISIIAIGRWNLKAWPVIIVTSLLSVLAGYVVRRTASMDGSSVYNWRMIITNILSVSTALLVVPFKKLNRKMSESKNGSFTVAMALAIVLIAYIVQVLTYSMITLTNPANYIMSFVLVNIPSWFFTITIMAILRHQGIFVDVKKDLVNKKKERELENQYYSKYRNEILDKPMEDDKSSNNKESGGDLQ
jgi:hypothetical protein